MKYDAKWEEVRQTLLKDRNKRLEVFTREGKHNMNIVSDIQIEVLNAKTLITEKANGKLVSVRMLTVDVNEEDIISRVSHALDSQWEVQATNRRRKEEYDKREKYLQEKEAKKAARNAEASKGICWKTTLGTMLVFFFCFACYQGLK